MVKKRDNKIYTKRDHTIKKFRVVEILENQGSYKTNKNQIDKVQRQIKPHRVKQNLIQDMKNQALTESDEMDEHRETSVLKTKELDNSIYRETRYQKSYSRRGR